MHSGVLSGLFLFASPLDRKFDISNKVHDHPTGNNSGSVMRISVPSFDKTSNIQGIEALNPMGSSDSSRTENNLSVDVLFFNFLVHFFPENPK